MQNRILRYLSQGGEPSINAIFTHLVKMIRCSLCYRTVKIEVHIVLAIITLNVWGQRFVDNTHIGRPSVYHVEGIDFQSEREIVTTLGLKKIAKDALFGIFFIRKAPGERYASYCKTIDILRPILRSREFCGAIAGFYLNHISEQIGDQEHWLARVSYFVDVPNHSAATSVATKLFSENAVVVAKENPPRAITLAANYGGSTFEERMRNFLNLETQIGLELMEADLLHARCLFATYRWQVRKAGLSFRTHFEPAFRRHSPTYNGLSDLEKDQFFLDLEEWPNPPQVDWAHMMVNLVLGCDWNGVFRDPNYLTPGRPLSIPQINSIVRELEFQIPLTWKP